MHIYDCSRCLSICYDNVWGGGGKEKSETILKAPHLQNLKGFEIQFIKLAEEFGAEMLL